MLRRPTAEEYAATPPVLANSFPKSGTHLLDQIVGGLPGRVNYGAFLSSMISSFQYRRRSSESTLRAINRSLPGEIVRGHLYYEPEFDSALVARGFVHYFIYRDPRDVVVSSSYFLRHMYPWHRLSRRLRALPTDADGVMVFTVGLDGGGPGSLLPNVAETFRRYEGWLSSPNVYAVRYEDLVGADRDVKLTEMAEFYAARTSSAVNVADLAQAARNKIAPEKSHTFRQGKRGNWQDSFTPELKDAFKRIAGDLLIRLGYERDHSW